MVCDDCERAASGRTRTTVGKRSHDREEEVRGSPLAGVLLGQKLRRFTYGCGSPRGTLCFAGDDAVDIPLVVVAVAFVGEVVDPVGVEIAVVDEGAELEDRFGALESPAVAGDVHTVFDDVSAGALDDAGRDRPPLLEGGGVQGRLEPLGGECEQLRRGGQVPKRRRGFGVPMYVESHGSRGARRCRRDTSPATCSRQGHV